MVKADVERHDRLVVAFMAEVVDPALDSDATFDELLAIFESVQVCMIEVMQTCFELSPKVAADMIMKTVKQATKSVGQRKDAVF